jgi:hypothetical protein
MGLWGLVSPETEVFPFFFPQLYGKCQRKTRKDEARPAIFLIFVLFYVFFCCSMYLCVVPCIYVLFYVLFVLCLSMYCFRVYVYCTTATGWLPNWSYMYHIISCNGKGKEFVGK